MRQPRVTCSYPALSSVFFFFFLFYSLSAVSVAVAWRPWPHHFPNSSTSTSFDFNSSKKFEGSSEFVHLRYHMGPILSSTITVHPLWYGTWRPSEKRIIRDFLLSFSAAGAKRPSVHGWWSTLRLYTDQTGANTTATVLLGAEKDDRLYSHGKTLTRLSIQYLLKSAVSDRAHPLPVDPKGGLYLVLTSPDVHVQDFCGQVCGFHFFTYPSIVGYTLPYAWVGNSATQCPGTCAYPFAVPNYIPGLKPLKSPNGDVGVDGMISVIAHEIAEVATDPLINGWYAGKDPTFPTEIADLCEGIYGTGGGGSYIGQILKDRSGASYNMNGIRRKFLAQWVWNPVRNYCSGPNALDQ